MSLFSANMEHRSFQFQITALCFVLGLLLAAAAFTAAQLNRAGVSPSNVAASYGYRVAALKTAGDESEIKKLNAEKTELENKLASGGDAAKTLNRELQEVKVGAGLTDVTGPGVEVVLTDDPVKSALPVDIDMGKFIHDSDIANVVNELKAAGADAIAVNNQRIVSKTAIRCVGPVVLVNMVEAAPPFRIQAIGDPETLYQSVNMSGGVLDTIRKIYPAMVHLEKRAKLLLPAYAGSTQMKVAKPVNTTPANSEKDNGSAMVGGKVGPS